MLYEIGVCVDTPYIVNDIADDCGYTTGTERKECGAEEAKAGGSYSYLKQFATSRPACMSFSAGRIQDLPGTRIIWRAGS